MQLEAITAYAKTNRKGVATFNLKVQTGLPGEYSLIFSAQNIQSSPSTTFRLLNRISAVKLGKNIETSAEVKILKIHFYNKISKKIDVTQSNYYTFTSQPYLNITYSENLVDLRNKTIEVLIYKAMDEAVVKEYQKQLTASANQTKTNMETLMQQKISDPDNIELSFTEIGTSLLNAVVNGGKLKRAVERVAMNFPIKYDFPTQDTRGNLVFNNLQINFQDVGEFYLIFVVNGIESELSNKITITQPEISVEDYVI